MRPIVCETPEQIRMAQALRYEVYCLEKGWIEPLQLRRRTRDRRVR